MNWVVQIGVFIAIIASVWLIDRALLWMEARGWLYWRKRKGKRGSAGYVDLFTMVDPGLHHVAEAKRKAREERVREADDKNGGQVGDKVTPQDETQT